MDAAGLYVFHVVLDCADNVLRYRIAGDTSEPEAKHWRLDHLAVDYPVPQSTR